MAIVDFFKRKRKQEVKKRGEIEVKPKKTKFPEAKAVEAKAKIPIETYRILKAPHLSEKTTELAKRNQYVFKVWDKTNKLEIKKAIKDLYGVEVEGIKIINFPRKRRRLGRIIGWRKGYKKAIVKIKEGQKIEIMPK